MDAAEPPRFVMKELSSKDEMPALVACQFNSYYDPYHPLAQALWPVLTPTRDGQLAAMAECVERQWAMHEPDPKSHWFYVVDQTNGRVAGGAQWYYHPVNPYAEPGPPIEAVWWPEGEARDFASMVMAQVFGPRASKMNRPHTCQFTPTEPGLSYHAIADYSVHIVLSLMFVHPDYRRRGVASLLMRPGVDKAVEMGVDSFIEATDPGLPLYEKFGYRMLYRGHVDSAKPNKSNEWKRLEHELGPIHWWFMWKPAGGTYEAGKTQVPFEFPGKEQ